MAKRKVRRARRSSSEDLFKTHPNLKWLLPLFVLVSVGFFLLTYL